MSDTPEHTPPQDDDAHAAAHREKHPLDEQISRFAAEILANREAIRQSKGDYTPLPEDEEYRLLYEKGLHEATKDYDLSHYPFYVPPRSRVQNDRKDNPDSQPIDWKKIEQKVYLKAFLEPDEDELEEQIRAEAHKRAISYEKTRQLILEQLAKSKDDFERFIYQDVYGKIAVLIFTLGVSMLIRYGISEGILPEWMRVVIGLTVSGILFAAAKRLEHANKTFGLLFAASALVILYYTNYLAFKEYRFLSQPVAFLLMLSVIGLSLWLSLYYNRRYFAVLAIAGAYITPFAVAGEQVYYEYFFGYLLLISIGIIVVAYFKRWVLLNYLTFVTTVLIFIGWMWRVNLGSLAVLQIGLVFSTLFYLTYFVMHLLHALRRLHDESQVPMSERDLFFFSFNTLFFVFTVYRLLSAHFLVGDYFGWWLAALGLFNGIVGWRLYQKPDTDVYIKKYLQIFALLGISIGIVFIWHAKTTLHLAWLAQTMALLFIGRYWRAALFRDAAALTFIASAIVLLIIWFSVYSAEPPPPFLFNKAVLATLASCVAYVTSFFLVKFQENEVRERLMFLTYEAQAFQKILIVAAVVLFYSSGNIELTYHRFSHPALERLLIGIYNTVFALLLWIAVMRATDNRRIQNVAHYVLTAAVISYIIFAHQGTVRLRNEFLAGTAKAAWFFVHYVNLILDLAAIYLLLARKYGAFQVESSQESSGGVLSKIDYSVWLASGALVFHLTAEFDHVYILFRYNPALPLAESLDKLLDQTRLFFYPILWAIIAFGFVFFGVKRHIKDLRIIASVLLGIMLVKLLAYDIWRVSRFTQILLLIVVGGLLFIVSYLNTQLRIFLEKGTLDVEEVYQKLIGNASRTNKK